MSAEAKKTYILKELKKNGCRITNQRKLLIDVILQDECSCCKEIYYKVQEKDRNIGPATIYRMVNMLEKIGNVTLDYEYYPGEDLYSDGPVEEELLEIAKNYQEKELNQLIYERNSWPVLYHFSHIRQNILEWLPITNELKVLVIVSCCGPSTGVLAR